MNLLLNILMSERKSDRIISNFIVQAVRFHDYSKYSKNVQESIYHCRMIDNYIQNHPLVKKSQSRLNPKFQKHSKVIINIFYDHLLATNWKKYSSEDLGDLMHNALNILSENSEILPYKVRSAIPELKSSGFLYSLHSFEGMHQYMKALIKIVKFNSVLETSMNDLVQNYSGFKEDFEAFMPQLLQYAESLENTEEKRILEIVV